MRKNIHPEYHTITVVMTNGAEYQTRSTWGKPNDRLVLEIDPTVHSAWTGGQQKLLQRGRLARFNRRFAGFSSAKSEASS